MLVSLALAPAFSFNPPLFVSRPPRHASGTREVLTVVCLIIAPFSSRPPNDAGGTREVLTGVCLIIVSPSITSLRVFPGFIAKPFRGAGVGFEELYL